MDAVCEKCTVTYKTRPSDYARRNHHFCSVMCCNGIEQNRMDLTGHTYGRLKVIEAICRTGKDRHKRYACLCKCGNTTEVGSGNLRSGKVVSCGCALKGANNKRPYEWLYNTMVSSRKASDLTYEEFVEFTAITECHYCSFPIHWSKHNNEGSRAYNLDRKDNKLGYIKGNLVVCCIRCNVAKMNHFTYDEFVQLGKVIKTFARS